MRRKGRPVEVMDPLPELEEYKESEVVMSRKAPKRRRGADPGGIRKLKLRSVRRRKRPVRVPKPYVVGGRVKRASRVRKEMFAGTGRARLARYRRKGAIVCKGSAGRGKGSRLRRIVCGRRGGQFGRTYYVIGTKRDVYYGHASATPGGLTQGDLMLNKRGKVVSRKQHQHGMRQRKNIM